MFFVVYNQTLGTMFQRTADEENDSSYLGGSVPTLEYLTHYKAILTVGEEASFDAIPSLEKCHIHLNENLAMVLP